MNNFDTVRLALTFDGWTPDDDEHRRWVAKALAALAAIESDHYSAADMADAQAKAFRAGVASVAGQEPVAWMANFTNRYGNADVYVTTHKHLAIENDEHGTPLPLVFGDAAPVAQQPQAERKPLFAEAIAQHPGLREELLEMDKQPQAEAVPVGVLHRGEGGAFHYGFGDHLLAVYAIPPGEHDLYAAPQQAEAMQYTRADLDRAYSAGLVEGERLAIQQAEVVQSDVDWPDVEDMAHSALQEALSFGLNHDVFHRFGKSVMQKTRAAIAQQKGSV